MRRLFGLVVLSALAPALLGAQQALVGMYPAGVGLDSGQQARIPLVLDLRAGSYQLGSYQLQVTWNPAVIRYVGVEAGDFGTPTVNEGSASAGSLTLAGASPAGRTGLFSVAQLKFEMLVASGSSPVTIVSPELTAATTFSTIPATATPGAVCTSAGTYGDVNHDGQILSNDALLVVTAAVGLPIAPYNLLNADVDGDGDTDTRDALIILSDAVGLPTNGFRVGQVNAASCAGAPAVALTLTPGSLALAAGDVVPVTAALFDAAGNPTSTRGIAWSSNAGAVASVDSTGLITAGINGTATIRATAIGVAPQTLAVTVQDRHTWFVDAAAAASHTLFLGSAAYPFPDVQTALDRAAAGDTVRIAVAPAPYGGAVIGKPVVVLGDSGAAGMPSLSDGTGTALVSNTSGSVTLRHLVLTQSNAGLDARGDSLTLQAVRATSLRGPGFRIHGMQVVTLSDVGVTSAVLAGVFADSNRFVRISGADIRVIALRNDSAAGIALLGGDSAFVSGLKVVGVDSGPGATFAAVGRVLVDSFSIQGAAGGGVSADSAAVAIFSRGTIQSGGVAQRPLSVHADSITIDTVVISGADVGVELAPRARDSLVYPNAGATIRRSSITTVKNDVALAVQRFGRFDAARLTISGVANGDGIDVQQVSDARIDTSVVTGVAQGYAVAIAPAASFTMRDARLRGSLGGLVTSGVRTVALSGVEVDSSAVPPTFCFGCSAGFAIDVAGADSVRLDSLNLHDNSGGGVLVDSARVAVGVGSIVVRNQGFGGSGGECGFSCQIGPGKLQSGTVAASVPVLVKYSANRVPGVVLNLTSTSVLSGWTLQDNLYGAVLFAGWDQMTGQTALLDASTFRGVSRTLVQVSGVFGAPAGQLTIQGGSFQNSTSPISVAYIQALTLSGVAFDSTGDFSDAALSSSYVPTVTLTDNVATNNTGYLFRIQNTQLATVLRNSVTAQFRGNVNNPEAAIELGTVDSAIVSGNRFTDVRPSAVNAYGGGANGIAIDSNVVTDSSGVAFILARNASLRFNRITGNYNGIFVESGGEASVINDNVFGGQLFDAIRWIASAGTTNAQRNYWNAADGPQCSGGLTGCISTTGDFADGPAGSIDFSSFLTGDPGTAPLSPPVLRATRRAGSR